MDIKNIFIGLLLLSHTYWFSRNYLSQIYIHLFKVFRKFSFVENKITEKMKDACTSITKSLKLKCFFYKTIPIKGRSAHDIQRILNKNAKLDENPIEGKISGAVYHTKTDIYEVATIANNKYLYSNPLHPDVYVSIRKMESEIVSMCIKLYNGDENACGTTTSGGTESIILACKAYRDYYKEKGIMNPEIIVPDSVHVAFDKACHLLGLKLIKIKLDNFELNIDDMENKITPNTILLVGSMPSFPHGIIDPMHKIACLGKKYDIPVHMDACLGGFLVPFIDTLRYNIEVFDFFIEGITSISVDLHKYGYAPKGISVIMYNNKKYLHHQYYVNTDWTGGIYASPTLSGSRPGNVIAATWSVMMHVGVETYTNYTHEIIDITKYISKELRKIKEIKIIGDPKLNVIAFTCDNIYHLNDEMSKKGWHLNVLQYPSALHICVTLAHINNDADKKFITDINQCLKNIKGKPIDSDSMGVVYGTSQKIPDRSIVKDISRHYLDCLYTTS